MKWTDPKLIDPGAGSDAELFCTDGIAPSWICYGGAVHGQLCDRGGSAPTCDTGSGGGI